MKKPDYENLFRELQKRCIELEKENQELKKENQAVTLVKDVFKNMVEIKVEDTTDFFATLYFRMENYGYKKIVSLQDFIQLQLWADIIK